MYWNLRAGSDCLETPLHHYDGRLRDEADGPLFLVCALEQARPRLPSEEDSAALESIVCRKFVMDDIAHGPVQPAAHFGKDTNNIGNESGAGM